jgi:hypothetical protein
MSPGAIQADGAEPGVSWVRQAASLTGSMRNRRATLVCFTERGWDEADACARILDHLDQDLARRVGADKLQQLQDLLAEVTNALHDSTVSAPGSGEPRSR